MSFDGVFKTAKWFKTHYDVSAGTLRNWALSGKLRHVQFPGGKRAHDCRHFATLIGAPPPKEAQQQQQQCEQAKYIYARVSSAKQAAGLERQIDELKQAYPDHVVVKDVASGVNWDRRGLRTILNRAFKGLVAQVVVMHRDRLSRFAPDLLQYILERLGVKLVVHGDGGGPSSSSGPGRTPCSASRFATGTGTGRAVSLPPSSAPSLCARPIPCPTPWRRRFA